MRTVLRYGRFLSYWLCVFAVLSGFRQAAADEPQFVNRTYVDDNGPHRYAIYVPRAYSSESRWPVVLYLHGAGLSGTDGRRQLRTGLAAVIRSEGDFPAIVVFPQCEDVDATLLSRWLADSPDGKRAIRILDDVEQHYSVDASRRVLAGWSMGGYGAWSLAAAHPELWSAVVPVSGGGRADAAAHVTAPVWAIHGTGDRAIPPSQSRQMVDAVNAAGGHAVLTELPGVAHDAWRYAFSSPTVREWMLSASPGVPDAQQLLQDAASFYEGGGADALDGEFRAALTVPRAVSIHIGNESLQTLACGAPSAVDPQMLSGKINDLKFDFSAVGEKFQITQSQISYDVRLDRILIDPQADGLLRLRAGLHPLTLTIGATRVHSATRSAEAGPIAIRLGPHYPLWIDLKVRPYVQDGRLHLETRRLDFRIPDDNWVVSPPVDVTVAGPDLTPDLARTALVGGLYTRRTQIEQCVRDMLPDLVEELEGRMQPTSVDRIVAGVWPMPVFRPRLRLLPEDVLVDDSGLSLVLGLAAAPLNDVQAAAAPVVLAPLGPPATELPHSQTLELGIASGVLEALSGMIVDSHAAHIDVRDMPEPEFALLGDRTELARILPELAKLGDDVEVRTELDLAAPLIVQRSVLAEKMQFTSADAGPTKSAESVEKSVPTAATVNTLAAYFEIPRLVVSILVRKPSESREWRPYAKFDVRLTHSAKVHLTLEGNAGRLVELKWSGAPDIEVSGGYLNAPSEWDAAVDRSRVATLIGDCWGAWTGSDTVLRQDVPDLVLGTAHLRIDSIDWRGVELVARYRTPETRITNSGSRLIDYAVRGQYAPWGPRLQLKPGETNVYSSTSALIVRRYPEPESSAITVTVGSELDLAAPAP